MTRQTRDDAKLASLLSLYHAAQYLGISTQAFDGWVWRYKIPSLIVDGERSFRRKDLNKAHEAWNDAMAGSNPQWVRQPLPGLRRQP